MPALLLAIAAALACAQNPKDSGGPRGEGAGSADADSIVLERSLCFGTCPAYVLVVTRAGLVRFESGNPGEAGRTGSGSLPPAAFASLLAQAATAGFFELPEMIAGSTYCAEPATDHPTVTVTIFRAGGAKRVEHDHGCYAGDDQEVGERLGRLRAFQDAIDEVAGSHRWVRPAPEQ